MAMRDQYFEHFEQETEANRAWHFINSMGGKYPEYKTHNAKLDNGETILDLNDAIWYSLSQNMKNQ